MLTVSALPTSILGYARSKAKIQRKRSSPRRHLRRSPRITAMSPKSLKLLLKPTKLLQRRKPGMNKEPKTVPNAGPRKLLSVRLLRL